MRKPPLTPDVSDVAPVDEMLTAYDRRHLVTYMRLLDAEKAGAGWQEVAKLVLGIDPGKEPERAHRAYQSHLDRARWMSEGGYRDLLSGKTAT